MSDVRPENLPDTGTCPPRPGAADQVLRPRTAADSARHPDRADDLYDDSLTRKLPPNSAPPVPADARLVDSTAHSTQADAPLPSPHVPLDHHDPFSNRPSTHPVGTTVGAATGAAAGAAAGAAIGAVAGPIGAAVGAAAGAIAAGFAGGAAGRVVAESIHPSTEDHYWQTHYARRPYVAPGTPYDVYRPAYMFGIETRLQHCEKSWSQAEPMLQQTWEQSPNGRLMPWSKASPAVHDAWDKLSPCDPDL
ncbi:MAG: hypothetical protein ACTHN5_01690 [Phycisphaerae bacterium]